MSDDNKKYDLTSYINDLASSTKSKKNQPDQNTPKLDYKVVMESVVPDFKPMKVQANTEKSKKK